VRGGEHPPEPSSRLSPLPLRCSHRSRSQRGKAKAEIARVQRTTAVGAVVQGLHKVATGEDGAAIQEGDAEPAVRGGGIYYQVNALRLLKAGSHLRRGRCWAAMGSRLVMGDIPAHRMPTLLKNCASSQPELEGNRIVLNATKQAPAPQASKILGRASHQRRRGSKEGASSALPFPLRGPIPSALQVFGRRGTARPWLSWL
jgi:hypothetical protein